MDGTSRGNREAIPHRAVAAALVAVVLSSAGCTICPDPFDYSGPVPDGSAPQNDFRARAGGILPLGAAPRPWPPLVRDIGRPAEMPVIADEEPEEPGAVVAEDGTAELRQTSVLVQDRADAGDGEVDTDMHEEAGVPNASPVGLLPVPSAAPLADPPNAETTTAGGSGFARGVAQASAVPDGVATVAETVATTTEATGASPAGTAQPTSEARESPGWRPRRRPTR
jgi:hypothetical protein